MHRSRSCGAPKRVVLINRASCIIHPVKAGMAEGVPKAETDAAKQFLSETLAERRWETAEVS